MFLYNDTKIPRTINNTINFDKLDDNMKLSRELIEFYHWIYLQYPALLLISRLVCPVGILLMVRF